MVAPNRVAGVEQRLIGLIQAHLLSTANMPSCCGRNINCGNPIFRSLITNDGLNSSVPVLASASQNT